MRRASGGLLRVAGGAIGTRQLVELVEQRSGVTHVAAHCAVGPTHAIRVETQMKLHELRHVIDDLVRIAEREQALPRHPGADDVVVVERHPLGPVPPSTGLAHVVQERGETQLQAR
jgi:hypothetical protein